MKVTISYEDAYDDNIQRVEFTHTKVETLEDLAWVYKEASQAAGFDVKEVGLHPNIGGEIWTDLRAL